ncbi:MAG: hypothetical protein KDC67_04360 [Ignavibacteriae bacterium]|nr:hypothetical protein [Ignavibacteriota bacterium]
MKTYISDIIPRIQRFSQKLDNLTLLTNQHWVVIDEIKNSKNVYIFRQNNELLISKNGQVEKAKWEYLGHNSLLIDMKENSYLFKHGFFDENILALKIDSKNEYAFLVNETRFDKELNSVENIIEFLNRQYIAPKIRQDIQSTSGISSDKKAKNYFGYSSPNYEISKKTESDSLFGTRKEKYLIRFDDGLSGEIYVKLKNNQAYYKDKKQYDWVTVEHHYEDFDFCVNALHYFLKTGKRLNEGYIISYS